MAQSTQNSETRTVAPNAPTASAWPVAAAKRGYTVLDGKVYHGSGGNIVEVPAPVGFDAIPEPVRPMVAQAVIEFVCNRIVQGLANGKAQEAATKAIANGDGDGSDDESGRLKIVEKLIRDRIAAMVRERKPDASEAVIDKTVDKYHDRIGKDIVASGSYTITRKGKDKTKAGETVEAMEL